MTQLHSRLSLSSIALAGISPDDPDYSSLVGLTHGVQLTTPTGFVPNSTPGKLRAKYVRIAPAVNKLLIQLHTAELVFILPTPLATKIPGIHFSDIHWAVKKGKPQGRPIGDTSAPTQTGFALNHPEVKHWADEKWGSIKHPTIDNILRMILNAADTHGWPHITLWKLDLKGAFTLMFVDPSCTQLLAFPLTDDLTLIHHTGMFGHTAMPISFDVITRTIRRRVRQVVSGDIDMYVDDIIGVSLTSQVQLDINSATLVCCQLLGTNAVEPSKTEFGRRVPILGWVVDLDLRSVSISRSNFLKTTYGFFSVNINEAIPVRTLERLASWSSRYSAVCRFMRPFTSDLYYCFRGIQRHVSIRLTTDTKRCILLWRMFLCVLELDRTEFTRPLESFRTSFPLSHPITVEYDASLYGIGIIFFSTAMGREEPLWVTQIKLPFPLSNDSSFQNTVEFIAVVMAVACLVFKGVSPLLLNLRGDNTTSLKWGTSEVFRRGRSRATAMCFTALGITYDFHILASEHLAGVDNKRCDSLSRPALHVSPHDLGFLETQIIPFHSIPSLEALLLLCDPTLDTTSDDVFYSHWRSVFHCVRQLSPTPR
jgi:hypothetical protein